MRPKIGVSEMPVSNRSTLYETDNKSSNIMLEPTTSLGANTSIFDNSDNNDEDNKKTTAKTTKFVPGLDLKRLTDIFNSYATKKTYATGFFNLALVATNFAQMKQLVVPSGGRIVNWSPLNIVLLTFVCLSLLLQFVIAVLLVFLARQGEFIDEQKRNQLIRSNNGTTLLAIAISIINIFINVFISV